MQHRLPINDLGAHTAPLREALLGAMTRVLDRGWFVLGPEVEAFEREFAAYVGVEHAVGVANGTDALELALRALGVAAGDEVLLAANAGMYAAGAVRAVGATCVFVDVDATDLVLDPAAVQASLAPRSRCIVATHLYGRMAPMPALRAIAQRAGVRLLEDCAQSHGARLDGVQAGAWGDAAAFSFYPTKNLGALGDGGLVACRDDAVAARLRQLRQYGWQKKYVATLEHGRNSRLDELQAAVLRAKLPHLDTWNARRRDIARAYAAVRHPQITHPRVDGDDYVAHLYVLRSPARDALRAHLDAHGIGCDVHYPLLDSEQAGFAPATLPVSDRARREILTLPCYPELDEPGVARVVAALAAWPGT